MKLSIIVPVHNNSNFTKNCITDLMRLPEDHEVIIVNNASTDATPDMLKSMVDHHGDSRLKIINLEKNLGFGRANNIGYQQARGENILFLNNDIRVKGDHEDWTDELIQYCEKNCLASANGGLLNADFRFIRETNSYVEDPYFYLSGWCIAASKKTFDRLTVPPSLGPWNEAFFAYYEDDDLSWRAQELGIQLKVVPVPVIHFGRMTSKKLGLGDIFEQSYHIFRAFWLPKRGAAA